MRPSGYAAKYAAGEGDVAVLNDSLSIDGLFYKKKCLAWCSDTQCESKF